MYGHNWGKAYYVRGERSGVYWPLQSCTRCGTTRNPITLRLVAKRGSSRCWGKESGPPEEEQSEERKRIREELKWLQESGETVNLEGPS